jgi:hypothetical protein
LRGLASWDREQAGRDLCKHKKAAGMYCWCEGSALKTVSASLEAPSGSAGEETWVLVSPIREVKGAREGVGVADDVESEQPPLQLAGAQRHGARVVDTQPPPQLTRPAWLDLQRRAGRAKGQAQVTGWLATASMGHDGTCSTRCSCEYFGRQAQPTTSAAVLLPTAVTRVRSAPTTKWPVLQRRGAGREAAATRSAPWIA